MPDYETDGTANLQANAQVYAGAGDKAPAGMGKDAGGDLTNAKTLSSPGKSASYGDDSKPSGVQNFMEGAT